MEKYTDEIYVRYSDIGTEGYADIAQIMTWFQNAATDHSASVGYSAEVLKEMGAAWIVLHWDITVHAFARYRQKLTVETYASGFSNAYGHRMFALKDMDGNVLAEGESVWLLYDLTQNKFRKVTEEMSARYGCNTKMPAEILRKWKLSEPETPEITAPWTVRRSDTDTNGHTNNVSYVRALMDEVPNGGALKQVRVTYKKALFLNETASLQIGNGAAAILRDGEVCTLFAFAR